MPETGTIDEQSLTWLTIERWANEKIEEARSVIDEPGTDAISTELQRGRLSLAKELLALKTADQPRPTIPSARY